jgi:hypothetical protein
MWVAAMGLVVAGFVAYLTNRPEPVSERLRYRSEGGEGADEQAAFLAEGAIRGRSYVAAYSHAYQGSGVPVLFAITLTVRNVDPERSLSLAAVDYHDTDGHLVRAFLEEPRVLAPMGTAEFLVERRDESGGSGANFLVEWAIEPGGHRPLCEAVMLGSSGPTGYAFSTVGVDVSAVGGAPSVPPAPALSSGGAAP